MNNRIPKNTAQPGVQDFDHSSLLRPMNVNHINPNDNHFLKHSAKSFFYFQYLAYHGKYQNVRTGI